jgi:outer membrane protein assembly factor BamB
MVRGEDWPQLRGPTGQGLARSNNLPTEWSKTKNVAWKQALPGRGWSSPVVAGGRIYLTTSVVVDQDGKKGLSLQALCLDAASGRLLWQREVFHPEGPAALRTHSKNSHASPTPILDGQRLYVHFGHQGTACLDLDGKVLWRNTSLSYQPVHGNGGSPIVADGALIFSCDGGDQQFVVALETTSGKVRWKQARLSPAVKKFAFGTPLVITVKGQQQVISPGADTACAYDPRSGKEIWRVRYDGYSVVPRPVYGEGLVFICTGYDSPGFIAVRPDGQGDVTDTHVAWSTRRAAPLTPSPVLVGQELYMISDQGVASCLDAKTGKVHWQERIGGAHSTSPLCAAGKIYFQDEAGTCTVVEASKQFKVISRNPLGERTLASHAVVDDALLIRTEEHLYRIQGR